MRSSMGSLQHHSAPTSFSCSSILPRNSSNSSSSRWSDFSKSPLAPLPLANPVQMRAPAALSLHCGPQRQWRRQPCRMEGSRSIPGSPEHVSVDASLDSPLQLREEQQMLRISACAVLLILLIYSSSRPDVSVRAAAGAAAGSPDQGGEETVPAKWKMPVYILGWYAFNIIFNILNKSTLNTFSCPWLVSTWQLAASGLFMLGLWATRLQPVPKIDKGFLVALLPVAFFHVVGHVSACLSFSQMAVSFAHIVKSAEPAFSVALSGPMLGQAYPIYVWLSLVPIVAGCAMSAMKEVSFAWNGFNNAMISNLGMVLRNILSKKSLVNYKHVDGINLFGLISIVSLLYCAPAAVYFEGSQWMPAWNAAVEKVGKAKLLQLLALSGAFYHLYNQASYMVLDLGITPVTFSVGNTMKRVAVVVSSVLFFKNPVSAMNWVGSSIAILGTYLYSVAMDKWSAEQKAKKAASQSQ